jgi:site-specific DNA recombinase
MRTPKNALGFVRLSDLRLADLDGEGQSKGNVDQEERIRDHGRTIGWTITRVIVENDLVSKDGKVRGVSAFKRRKVTLPNGRNEWRTFRPGFRLSLDLMAKGEHDGFLALDLDRAVRDPRDLEDLIDVAEEYRVPVESVTGSLRLATDADITMARVMVAMANKSSRDTARRVAAARERQAVAGEYGGGKRPFGFEPDGVTVRPAEKEVIADCSQRLVQGATLRSMAMELREREVPTVTGARWTAETLRDILTRPRNAGRMVYRGDEIGDAPWPAIVPLETFRAIQRIVADPNRRLGPGPAPKWLGTNVFYCGICTDEDLAHPVQVAVRYSDADRRRTQRMPRYICKERNHLARSANHVNKYIEEIILARLALPDAVDLLIPSRPDVDVAALRAEAAAIRTNLDEMAADKATGLISRAQLIAGTARGRARVDDIEAQIQAALVESPLQPLIAAADIESTWRALPLSHQRLVVRELITVRILPNGHRGPGFHPETVEVKWKPQESVVDAPTHN